ncbi:MAG: MarR family transcriptional regulator [Bacteroidia bacterium]|nr:MarR family transcriptional regulator [Bacteroidia bacterium]
MEKDFLKELEYLGITARLKRLSDAMSYSIKNLYKEEGLDIEPSWHLILLYLKEHSSASMSEVAEAFNYSQPAITKMIRKIVQRGYLLLKSDPQDSRKKLIRLSEKAHAELPRFERVWEAGQNAIRKMLVENEDFLLALDQLEREHQKASFQERVYQELKE